uniref:RING-type E3 ubiquitin transferase n=1 Tax=Pelusios castaneus TaxID=367368 RepID=A0A8C8S6T6_9SAUR
MLPIAKIQEETICPICLEYLTDPASIDCGHNVSRACLTQYWETWDKLVSGRLCCPRTGNLFGRHNRALDLFCEEDSEAVCVVCWRSPEHRSHTVLLMEEAAQKYKVGNDLVPPQAVALPIHIVTLALGSCNCHAGGRFIPTLKRHHLHQPELSCGHGQTLSEPQNLPPPLIFSFGLRLHLNLSLPGSFH